MSVASRIDQAAAVLGIPVSVLAEILGNKVPPKHPHMGDPKWEGK